MYQEALEQWKEKYAIRRQREVVEALDRGYAEGGYARAMVLAAEKLAVLSGTVYVHYTEIAGMYAEAGKTGEALAWLEKAYDVRDPNTPTINVIPHFAGLRSDPRFRELLRRMNLPQN